MAVFAFVFPGQGSQSVGMLADLAATYPVVKDTFAEASEVLKYDLFDLVMNGLDTELGKTFKTQPALLTASIALYRLWKNLCGAEPFLMAGHSLGEYSALTAAGVIKFSDAVNLVRLRGEFMQEAVPVGTGAMAAIIGLPDDAVVAACADAAHGDVCSAVNFNSPGQVVIAGNKDAVARAGDALKALGAKKVIPLAVSVPSHCALMKGASEKLAVELEKIKFSIPSVPVINNVDVSEEKDADKIRKALVRQLFNPVRWVETEQKMVKAGVDTLIEVGPGKVLTGLSRRICKTVNALTFNDEASVKNAVDEVLKSAK